MNAHAATPHGSDETLFHFLVAIQSDADHFFVKSVRYGKQKFGVVHMPPWEGVLEPSVMWSLRTFVENAPMQ